MPTSTTAPVPNLDDPYEAHFHREPLPAAEVRIVLLAAADDDPARSQKIADGLLGLLAARNRRATACVVPVSPDPGWGPALDSAVQSASAPLILVTTATQPWTDAHLAPLLKAIDSADHVLGIRNRSLPSRLARWLGRLPWRILFHIPLSDLHTPCRLHRREAIAAIPLQSRSGFADVELLAKATFLGHLVDETAVPELPAATARVRLADLREVFRKPVFVRPEPAAASMPAEQPKRQQEGSDRPEAEDRQGAADVHEPRPLQQHMPKRADELGQR